MPELDDLMDELFGGAGGSIDDSGTKEIFDGLKARAKKGDTRAAEIILAYAYGKPKQAIEHTGAGGSNLFTVTPATSAQVDALLNVINGDATEQG